MQIVDRNELEGWQRDLLYQARQAARTANCPFSGYPVGAAVRGRGRDGAPFTVTGNNSETANYRSVCAEKHAVHRALAEHSWEEGGALRRPELEAVAVYCAVGASPQQPCGDCRQTLHELEPDLQVIAAAGPPVEAGGVHDPRVTLSTIRELLPYGFELASRDGRCAGDAATVRDTDALADHVVHLPRPDALQADAAARTALLAGVRHLILVGSPRRARKIAELAHARFGAALPAEASCYCDLTVPGRDETGREFAVYVPELAGGARVAVVSHGIGVSGVEIVLSELPALLALAAGGKAPELRGVIRCGTRGTLSRVPLGCVALSTACHDEALDVLYPDPAWLDRLRAAARELGMERVADEEVDQRGEDGWPAAATVLAEGPGISTTYFWQGQARPLYRAGRFVVPEDVLALERRDRGELLAAWVRAGIRWIEMEDHAVLRFARLCGLPAVTLGAVVGRRRAADGTFQLSYDKAAVAQSELLPAQIALQAIAADR